MLNRASKSDLLSELKTAGATIKADGREIICPFHEDKSPSGSVYEKDGIFRFKCHAASCGFCGDVFDVVAKATGKSVDDVLKEHGDKQPPRKAQAQAQTKEPEPTKVYADMATIKAMLKPESIEAEYTYTNPSTHAADLVVIRYRDTNGKKRFWQVSPVQGGWILKRPPGRLPLYNRIQVAEAKTVVVVEGEKCVHALRRCGHGGTTSPMGAGKASYADWTPLAGKTVILWPDNDEGGRKHMQEVASILERLDPITMAMPVRNPWDDAKMIMDEGKHAAEAHGCSIVFVTHMRKGAQAGDTDSLAGGAAYERFADTIIQLQRHDSHESTILKACGRVQEEHNQTIFIEKARAPGTGFRLAYHMDPNSLTLDELGVIVKKK